MTAPTAAPVDAEPVVTDEERDRARIAAEITGSIRQFVDHLADRVPGVTGAVVASADGFVLASRLPYGLDDSAVAAMSAATVALAGRLAQLSGPHPLTSSVHRSPDGQVLVCPVAHVAVLTVLATPGADTGQLQVVAGEVTRALLRLFRGTADV